MELAYKNKRYTVYCNQDDAAVYVQDGYIMDKFVLCCSSAPRWYFSYKNRTFKFHSRVHLYEDIIDEYDGKTAMFMTKIIKNGVFLKLPKDKLRLGKKKPCVIKKPKRLTIGSLKI